MENQHANSDQLTMGKSKCNGVWCAFAIFLLLSIFPHVIRAENRLKVVTSIFPFQEFAREVGGKRVNVALLLPPGVEAHSWEPTPTDMLKVREADVFIYVGAGMEPYIHNILRGADRRQLSVLDASKEACLLDSKTQTYQENSRMHATKDSRPHMDGHLDPHLWLDIDNDIKIVNRIAEVFSYRDPGGASYYAENASKYNKKLMFLDTKYKRELKYCQQRRFIFGGHAAFAYLAKRYGLEQIPLYSINPEAEPTPKKLADLVKISQKYRIQYIYFEELVSDKLARVMAQEVGAQTLVLNPGGNLTRDQFRKGVTFLDIMEQNLESLKRGLECGK
jgi:zinc transport system substrate-binding protein